MLLFLHCRRVCLVLIGTVVAQAGCSRDTGEGNSPVANVPKVGYQGTLDLANCEAIQGWAMANENPDTPVSVEIFDGKELLSTVLADQFREGLLNNKKGNGKHQFTFPTPPKLKDGKPHEIHAKIVGTDFELNESPKSITCQLNESPANSPSGSSAK